MNYDDLFKGWFDRDGDKFVKLVNTNRLGWADKSHEKDGFSTFMAGKITDEMLIRKAYEYGRDTIITMGLPVRVTLKLHPTMSATDHYRMWVATECFDERSLTPNQRLDIFLGLTVHECCHVLYTDNEYLKTQPDAQRPVIHSIWNTIEDEYIETRCADDSPGYMNYLAATKDYHFNFKYKKRLEQEAKARALAIANGDAVAGSDEIPMFDRLMDILFKIVRYPKYLKPEDIAFYGKYIVEMKAILCPFPKSTQECFEATLKIWELFKKFYKEPPVAAKNDDELVIAILTDDPASGTADPNAPEPDIIIDMRSGSKSEIDETTGDPMKTQLEKDAIKSIVIQAMEAAMEKGVEHDEAQQQRGLKMASILGNLPNLAKILECSLEEGEEKGVYFEKMGPDQAVYTESRRDIVKYIGPVRSALQNHGRDQKIIHKGMRNGYLDTGKLVEARLGVPTIYETHGTVKSDNLCLVLVVDESGSMSGSKIKAARSTAILLLEALEGIAYIEIYVYGHTADQSERGYGSTNIRVYREPGWAKRFAAGTMQARANNRDGVAIHEIAKRVRKSTARPGLMFVLADGQPNASGYKNGVEDTRRKVKLVQQMNFQVVQVAIDHTHDPSTMYDHYIILKDMNKLAKELSQVVRKAAERLSKIHVT